jgi:hypothetical protein
MATTYRVVEAGATEPDDLERWLNTEAAAGWRVVSISTVPANKVDARTHDLNGATGQQTRPSRRE